MLTISGSTKKRHRSLDLFLFLFLLCRVTLCFAQPAQAFSDETSKSRREVLGSRETSVATYPELLSAIRDVRHQTEARIEAAVEQEKVREAWETGKLIQEHILLNKDRAEYGKQVIEKLSVERVHSLSKF